MLPIEPLKNDKKNQKIFKSHSNVTSKMDQNTFIDYVGSVMAEKNGFPSIPSHGDGAIHNRHSDVVDYGILRRGIYSSTWGVTWGVETSALLTGVSNIESLPPFKQGGPTTLYFVKSGVIRIGRTLAKPDLEVYTDEDFSKVKIMNGTTVCFDRTRREISQLTGQPLTQAVPRLFEIYFKRD